VAIHGIGHILNGVAGDFNDPGLMPTLLCNSASKAHVSQGIGINGELPVGAAQNGDITTPKGTFFPTSLVPDELVFA
jgi:hypothetical protein